MNSIRQAVRRHRALFLAFVLLETFFFIDGTTFVEASQHQKQLVRSEKLATARVLGVTPRPDWIDPPNWLAITGESLATQTEEILESAKETARDWFSDWTLGTELGANAGGSWPETSVEGSRGGSSVSAQQLPRRLRKSAAPPRVVSALTEGEGEQTRAPSMSSAESADKRADAGLTRTADRLPVRQQNERKARQIDAGALPPSKQLSSSIAPPSAPRTKSVGGTGRQLGKAVAPEITALAASLGNSPGRIFRHVHDSIDYDPKWGADSPPLGTLWEARGTSWDQAWLLQELLLAAGVDARLEWGEVEISPELLMEIAGTDDPIRAGDLLTTAGLPVVLLIVGSQVASARMPHAWVKAHLDYIPNRGATAGTGDTWIRMDPSLKTFERNDGLRLDADVSYVLEDHLLSGTEQSPRAEYESALLTYVADNNLGASSLEELKALRSLRAEDFPFVPGTLRAKILSAAGESETMPDAYQVQLEVKVRRQDGGPLLTWQAPLSSIYGGLFEIRWPGATSADQSTLDLYGGVYATPPYEVDLRPALTLDGVEVASGTSIGSAEDVELNLTATPPAGLDAGDGVPIVARWEMFAGEHGAISVDFGHAPQQLVDRYIAGALAATEPFEVEAWSLAAAAGTYLQTLGSDLEHLAALRWHQSFNFGTAVLAVQRGAVSTTSSGTPDTFSQGPLSINVGARTLGLYPVDGVLVSRVPTLELIGSQGSVREGEALESIFGGDHVTAVGFLTLAVREGQTLTRVDAGNVEAALATAILSSGAEAAVAFAVSQGAIAWIPETQLELNGWRTTGYIIEDPATGGGGYFVTFERLFTPLDGAVIFHSPADLDVITQPTDVIATIDVEGIETWTLSTRPTGGDGGQVIGTGTGPVANTVVGRFDPTLLLNGMHDLILSGQDAAGQSVSGKITVVVEGQMKIGNFSLRFLDLAIPVSGLDIEIIRTYDSRQRGIRGDFGNGWSLEIKQGQYQNNVPPGDGWQVLPGLLPCQNVLESKDHLTTIRISDQEIYRFRPRLLDAAPSLGGCFARVGFEFLDGPSSGAILEVLGNDDVFYENGSNRVLDVDLFELFEPDAVRLTTRDLRVFDLDLQDGVTRLADANGNSLQISDSGITHSSGKGIVFERDGQGRILSITDPLDRVNRYSYDGDDNLARFTDRAAAETVFTYSAGHYLTEVVNSLGVQAVRNEYDDDGRLVRILDASGNAVEFGHETNDRREVVTDRLGNASVFEYDARGNVTREVDSLGNITRRIYDAKDRLLSETDPAGNTTTNSFNSSGELLSSTDPLGNVVSFSYDDRGNILTREEPLGRVLRTEFDPQGNILRTIDPTGAETSFSYDSQGNLLSETDDSGNTATFEYDSAGNLIGQVDASGVASSFSVDAVGNRTSTVSQRTTATGVETLVTNSEFDELNRTVRTTLPDGSIRRTRYTTLGQVAESIDPLGRSTLFTYDDHGKVLSTTYPDGTTTSLAYDIEGRVIRNTDRAGRAKIFEYDSAGRIVRKIFPDGSFEELGYDSVGRVESITDTRGFTTLSVYDAAGQRSRIVDPLGGVIEYEYDAVGLQSSITDPLGRETRFLYNAVDELVQTTFADDSVTQAEFDGLGRRVAEVDAAGRRTEFSYDPQGRLASVLDALGGITSFSYDEQGNRISQTDSAGKTTTFQYDSLGRPTARTLPDGAQESMSYDLAGNLLDHTDFSGRTTTMSYDAADRLVSRVYADGSREEFTYSVTGQRIAVSDARGITTYEYDDRDRMVTMIAPDASRLDYGWDQKGNRTSLAATVAGNSFATTYTYDALNRLSTVTDPAGRVYQHGYDANGNRSSLQFPNGVTTSYTYSSLDRLTELSTSHDVSGIVANYAYTLGPTGIRNSVTEADGTLHNYGYDDLNRLTSEQVAETGGTELYSKMFTYDAVGNRTSQVSTGIDASTISYVFDQRDRLIEAGGETLTWDANGNLGENAEGEVLSWNQDDRLSLVVRPDGTEVRNTYDADGNRFLAQVMAVDGSTSEVRYLIDTSQRLAQVVAEIDSQGDLIAYYVRGDDLLAVDRVGSGARYFHADGLGSIRALTDQAGTVTDRYRFTAFGELLEHQGDDVNAFLFAGEMLDPNSGFYYNRARWMDPASGRFVSMDPHPGTPFDPLSLHRYSYAHQTPVNATDPTGEMSLIGFALVQGFIGALLGFGITYATTRNIRKSLYSALGGFIIGFVVGGALHYLGGLLAARHAATAAAAAGTLDDVFIHGNKLKYLLKLDEGKANGFNLLGYTLKNADDLASVLKYSRTLIDDAATPVVTEFGTKFKVAMQIVGANGRKGIVDVVWQVDHGSHIYRLITAIAKPF